MYICIYFNIHLGIGNGSIPPVTTLPYYYVDTQTEKYCVRQSPFTIFTFSTATRVVLCADIRSRDLQTKYERNHAPLLLMKTNKKSLNKNKTCNGQGRIIPYRAFEPHFATGFVIINNLIENKYCIFFLRIKCY